MHRMEFRCLSLFTKHLNYILCIITWQCTGKFPNQYIYMYKKEISEVVMQSAFCNTRIKSGAMLKWSKHVMILWNVYKEESL